ncbi:type III restriction-modification system endonuclease [Verminephrobacter aporrectodeae]|uniref:type III restriction-modification system endonuclease n=1 Tax=Verminephrobacter aporrectodeae TaxID=1110389 RepID=UPI002244BF98|nr:DEAD/DEAH box helicase family protein [Verminephrobacter aporrectodeae]MCW8175548.1 restriction endonuclease subunit R [Verminephrobacter aporrectodeae subsp. tuberculatae]MCW8198235.1 restriction endonuclease subunit R [Verminephrobacter aporrectodeae subsp. tuberculatae]MCW8203135.1 restriction endonuclease subunit R [Verminephrobacter aporrectodeae subsp. tuberculatae]
MKLHFESDLPYQAAAIDAVCDLFRGQEVCRSEFTVTVRINDVSALQESLEGMQESTQGGIGNRLTLLDDEIYDNLRAIQLRNGLAPSTALSGDFTVEMETGTGKTYVYLRSIFELNRRYGFTKFVVVVPSVAIKEGVNKTLQITREHFESLYPGAKGYEYFPYDSEKLGQVRNFATSPNVQIMVITVGAINKFGDEGAAAAEESDEIRRREQSKNKMYRASEKTGGERPIDLIRNTRPILVVDEPQSVDGGIDGKGKKALERMDPLCTLRYSATHVDKHNMLYRLDAVDAYEQKLVKQIEVAAATVRGGNNKPYVKLLSVSNKKGVIAASVEVDRETAAGAVRRDTITVQDGFDLEQATGRPLYANIRVGEIRTTKADPFIELKVPGHEVFLRPGQTWGDVDVGAIRRAMICRTIKEHLDKEMRLRPLGVKVLSLFFIDEVAKYRQYDEQGHAVKGEYATMFEEEYQRWARHPDYQSLFADIDLSTAAAEVHDGYFSIDTKKVAGRSVEMVKDTSGSTRADDDTYSLIMREKEKLLSFESPLKFIFSHSALKEGWDNPNVFQICNFSTRETDRWRRQTIGRGLRLCVNQQGERLRGFEVNTLTVIATESYEDFAENLQKDIERDTGIEFGVVQDHAFASIAITRQDDQGSGDAIPLGVDASKILFEYLKAQDYVSSKGKVQDRLKTALKEGTLELPTEFEAQRAPILAILKKLSGKLEVQDADKRKQISVRKSVLLSPDFKALWDRIKHKTTYRVHFDNEQLIENCTKALHAAPQITKTRLQWRKAGMAIGKAGIEATEKAGANFVTLNENDIELPDLLTELQDRTQLTRKTIVHILTESRRLDDFKRNPQQFIELAAQAINRCKRRALVDGIKYQRLGDEQYFAQELFETQELTGYLKNLVQDTRKSVYEHVVYDSSIERDFAEALEKNDAIKVYAKLPGWFKVPTPLGSYNPDWAVLVERDGHERLYFVVETKGSLFDEDLYSREVGKITCGAAHFKALAIDESPVIYDKFKDVDGLMARVNL